MATEKQIAKHLLVCLDEARNIVLGLPGPSPVPSTKDIAACLHALDTVLRCNPALLSEATRYFDEN